MRNPSMRHAPRVGEVGGQLPGHMLAVGCRGPRPGDRDPIIDCPREEGCRATSPKDAGPPVAKIVERGWPFLVAGDKRGDTSARGSDNLPLKRPSI